MKCIHLLVFVREIIVEWNFYHYQFSLVFLKSMSLLEVHSKKKIVIMRVAKPTKALLFLRTFHFGPPDSRAIGLDMSYQKNKK